MAVVERISKIRSPVFQFFFLPKSQFLETDDRDEDQQEPVCGTSTPVQVETAGGILLFRERERNKRRKRKIGVCVCDKWLIGAQHLGKRETERDEKEENLEDSQVDGKWRPLF